MPCLGETTDNLKTVVLTLNKFFFFFFGYKDELQCICLLCHSIHSDEALPGLRLRFTPRPADRPPRTRPRATSKVLTHKPGADVPPSASQESTATVEKGQCLKH